MCPFRTAKRPECWFPSAPSRQKLEAILFFSRNFDQGPKFVDRPIIVMEQAATAKLPLDAINEMINNITQTTVFFSLQPDL